MQLVICFFFSPFFMVLEKDKRLVMAVTTPAPYPKKKYEV